MKIKTLKHSLNSLLITFATLFLSLSAMAQEDELRDLPGFVDFGELAGIYGDPKVEISVGAALLGFLSAVSKNEDPETAEIFETLKGVRVNVYELNGDAGPALDQMDLVIDDLKRDNWAPVVRVNDEDEHVQIFMKLNGSTIEGLTLMAVGDDDEAVFINVIGNLDPDKLAKVTDKFDIDLN